MAIQPKRITIFRSNLFVITIIFTMIQIVTIKYDYINLSKLCIGYLDFRFQ